MTANSRQWMELPHPTGQVNDKHVTPHAEAFQAVIWHLLVTHPALKQAETKWESVK